MPANFLLLSLLCFLVCVFSCGRGEISRRTDDENPLVVMIDKLSKDLLAVQAQLAAQQNEIEALTAASTPPVAFSAYISDQPNVHAAKGSSAPFRGIIVNTGGGYSGLTSAFTTPVSGQYFFIVSCDCSSDFNMLEVLVNGHAVFIADNDGNHRHVTGSAVMTLQKGDVVTTKYASDVGYLDGGRESTFSGFLVK